MEIGTMFKNGALESARQNLADNPKALRLAANVFDKAKGNTQERLLVALDTAIESLKEKVDLLDVPNDLEEKTCTWLRAFASQHGIWYSSSDKKTDLILHISHEANKRKFFS
jgi:hypothetical protein